MKAVFPRESYIPKDSVAIEDKDADGVVYHYERDGLLFAAAFHGKKAAPDWHFRFQNAETRDKRTAEHFTNLKGHKKMLADYKAERKAKALAVKVGDILYTSWGYDQTNVDYFQVVEVRGKQFTIRQLAQTTRETGFMCGYTEPVVGHFAKDSKPLVKRSLSMEFSGLYPWEGRPIACSWYG